MRLLISNDDGIFALGIQTLANTLAAAGHEITVVCPDGERSATGHGLTLHDPLRAEQVSSIFAEGVEAWACSGTPADCVKLALGAILPQPPDFVVSGINHGPNLGTDVLYSGTVSAAMEGTIEGIPSVALSLASYKSRQFQVAADFAVSLLAQLKEQPAPEGVLLNVNIPDVERGAIAGVQLTRQGVRRYHDIFERRVDPRGKTYFWLAGEVLEDVDSFNPPQPELPPTDVQSIHRNWITITPLQFDWTSYQQVSAMPKLTF
ncbi:MAG: 5'/3'-nucleotidase SurE [Synechococcales cyanobacterium RU_4_20]|nr:5'/3'-nucleotidase SurE [Synechococcales cyanobacterium RU_4_20]NJR67504.1 5'/3'-nucleotidase SurE [Synechococcales cyanobacterium CRU_2_2]